MKPDDFEQKLSHQPLRQIPGEWRAEILAATISRASRVESRALKSRWPSTLVIRLSTIFWPHPKAWAGLATVWIFILALNFSTRDNSSRRTEKSVPPSPEMLVELKKQQRLFAELVGPRETPDADRQKILFPRPRSQWAEILVT
jgi:hypothetical protein